MIAWFFGALGSVSAFLIARQVLNLSIFEAILCIVSANVTLLVALFATLRIERTSWTRKILASNPKKTWVFFLALFSLTLFILARPIRDPRNFLFLGFPLFLSSGFAIHIFGPIQDRRVARIQRRSRKMQQV